MSDLTARALASKNVSALADIALLVSGLDKTGAADVTTLIQTKLNGMTNGGTLKLPAGKYKITSLTIPEGVILEGDYSFDSVGFKGTLLYCTDTTNPAVQMSLGTSIRNIGFYYPNQTYDSVNVKPSIAYPASIQLVANAKRVLIENIYLINSYYGIDATNHHELLTINNVQGYCMFQGINLDNCTDIDRIESVHFNFNSILAYNDPNATNYGMWTRKNGTAFTINYVDWLDLNKCFAWGYKTSYVLQASPSNSSSIPAAVHFNKCGADATGQILNMSNGWGIEINGMFGTCFYPTANFGSTEAVGDTAAYAIYASGGVDITITNSEFWSINQGVIRLSLNRSIISNTEFKQYGTQAQTLAVQSWAITLYNGHHIITGCQFEGNSYQNVNGVYVASQANSTKIVGCSFNNLQYGYGVQTVSATNVISMSNGFSNVSVKMSINSTTDILYTNDKDIVTSGVIHATKFDITGTTVTTVGVAGTAAALPSTPVGYVTIQVGGTNYKMPYYNV